MIRSPFLSSSRWRYRSLCLAVSAALVGLTGVAQASQSVNFDVLSSTRPSVSVEAHGASAKLGRAVPGKRDDSRLGLPTFFQAPASLGKRSGPLYLVKDVAALARGYLSDLAPQYKMRAADVDNLETVDIQRLDNGAAIVRFDNRIDGVVVFPTAAAPAKLAEQAKYITKVHFGAQYAGALVAKKSWFEEQPEAVQEAIRAGVAAYAKAYRSGLEARVAGAYKALEAAGAEISEMEAGERKRWADALPNIAMDWAKAQDAAGLAGTEVLKAFMAKQQAAGEDLIRDWSKE